MYTPPDVAAAVLEFTVAGWPVPERPVVLDPACGDGSFLLAAASWLEGLGLTRREIVEHCVHGQDLDPSAVTAAVAALERWAGSGGGPAVHVNITVGDALDGAPVAGRVDADLVIGNPPFLQQLSTDTARPRQQAAALRERWGTATAGYADTAAVFLAAALGWCRPGGRVGLILPESVLAARDAAGARRAVAEAGGLRGLWWAGERVFDAGVEVCAVVVERGAAPGEVRRAAGRQVRSVVSVPAPDPADRWAPLVADLRGVPPVELTGGSVVGDRWTITAGFRDQYYGLAPFVSEAAAGQPSADRHPLVTVGLIDPANLRWGGATARYGRRSWRRPVVDGVALAAHAPPPLVAWAARVLVPKVLVATQTRVIEAVVDEPGTCWPSVPTVAVIGPPDELWHAAAALSAPAVTAWALAAFGGTALHRDALKLSAAQVRAVPLPPDRVAWDAGAAALERAQAAAAVGDGGTWRAEVEDMGAAMGRAYRSDPAVLRWWSERLPGFRR